jgi:uncharacterized protein (DUF2267 family)
MFEEYESKAREFVNDVASELQLQDNPDAAIRIMTSVLHGIRDILTVQESLHLISQLPLLIKGLYVSEWHVGERSRARDTREFIDKLIEHAGRTGFVDFGDEEKAMKNVKAVIHVLRGRLTTGEIDHIVSQFPEGLKHIWTTDPVSQE